MKRLTRFTLHLLAVGLMTMSVTSCGSSVDSLGSSVDSRGPAITLEAGQVVTFSKNEAGGSENGWWDAQDNGTWSQSDRPVLNLKYDDTFNNGMNLVISMSAFVVENNPEIFVSVKANGEPLKELKFDIRKPSEEVSLSISKEILSKKKGRVSLTFEVINAAVPNEVGHSSDMRKLGIFLGQMVATPAP